jgi:hypothetical protein
VDANLPAAPIYASPLMVGPTLQVARRQLIKTIIARLLSVGFVVVLASPSEAASRKRSPYYYSYSYAERFLQPHRANDTTRGRITALATTTRWTATPFRAVVGDGGR